MMNLRLIDGFPAIVVNSDTLIISDLHLGKINIRDLEAMNEIFNYEVTKISHLLKKFHVSTIIINGDIKEAIGVPRKIIIDQINELFRLILRHTNKIIMIIGNHDGKIKEILNKDLLKSQRVKIKRYEKISVNNLSLLVTHGHIKLNCNKLRGVDLVISAHIHPALSLLDSSKLKVKIWGIFDVKIDCFDTKYLKWILMPAFASYILGIPLNELSDEALLDLSPFPVDKSKIFKRNYFLLDLTALGSGD